MTRCVKCNKKLNPETTGYFPFAEGYICSACQDKTNEEVCHLMDEYENPEELDTENYTASDLALFSLL